MCSSDLCADPGTAETATASGPNAASSGGVAPLCASTNLPRAFLAFVFAHELSHRVNDYEVSGLRLRALADVPAQGDLAEPLADLRAAFFTNAAGYSTRGLERSETLDCFLASVQGYSNSERECRKRYLKKAVENFDRYEEIYQVGVAMAMADETEAGRRLLTWEIGRASCRERV